MRFANFRVESSIKNALGVLSEKSEYSFSEIVRDIIWIGIGVMENGGLRYRSHLGIPLPFAKINYGGKNERLNVWLEEEQLKEAENVFGSDSATVIREAVRLGLAYIEKEKMQITGPMGILRPFSIIDFPEITREQSILAYNRLVEIARKID